MDITESAPSSDISERLLAIIAKEGMVDREKLKPDASLESLGVASADVVIILMAIEEEFGVYIPVDSELAEVRTVGDLTKALTEQINRQAK